jgi:phospholipid-transporting ATPase
MWNVRGKQFSIVNGEKIENYWKDNTVRTNKYTLFTFIPVNLFAVQFAKAPNVYFVIITIMQCFSQISISNGKPAMLPPLLFVLGLSMLKDAYEDYKRYKAD